MLMNFLTHLLIHLNYRSDSSSFFSFTSSSHIPSDINTVLQPLSRFHTDVRSHPVPHNQLQNSTFEEIDLNMLFLRNKHQENRF